MKQIRNYLVALGALAFISIMPACTEKDLYNSASDDSLPVNPDDYFDFSTKTDCPLSVDYHFEMKVLIEVYDENPIQIVGSTGVKKAGVEAIFKAYTDEAGKFVGSIPSLPSDVKEVYLYTPFMGLPQCVLLQVNADGISYEYGSATKSVTRAEGDFVLQGTSVPYVVDAGKKVYSLTNWTRANGDLPAGYGTVLVEIPSDRVTAGGTEIFGKFINRLRDVLWNQLFEKQDNSHLVSPEEKTNVRIAETTSSGNKIEKANVDLVFMVENTYNVNSLGYYYYKTDDRSVDIKSLPKFLVFPNASYNYEAITNPMQDNAPVKMGTKVSLKYFGENYDQAASDYFPAGYSIGWFILSNGFTRNGDGTIALDNEVFYSNQSANKDSESRCITLFDKPTKNLVIGFEDGVGSGNDKSFDDVMFYVISNPIEAIVDPEKPDVPSTDGDWEVALPDITTVTQGTLSFEDLWPSKGDYDMNDLVCTYHSSVTFNSDNEVVSIEDVFTPVHDGAGVGSAFGYQYENIPVSAIESVVIERPQWAVSTAVTDANGMEAGQSKPTFVLCDNFKHGFIGGAYTYKGASFKVTTTIKKESKLDKSLVVPPYNPFIIIDFDAAEQSRKEVHLPKKQPTDFVDKSLFGKYSDESVPEKGLYYVSSLNYPFALDIPATNLIFDRRDEGKLIDIVYPKFANWVKTYGKEDSDWYKK